MSDDVRLSLYSLVIVVNGDLVINLAVPAVTCLLWTDMLLLLSSHNLCLISTMYTAYVHLIKAMSYQASSVLLLIDVN